jgi:hypothetical protein
VYPRFELIAAWVHQLQKESSQTIKTRHPLQLYAQLQNDLVL